MLDIRLAGKPQIIKIFPVTGIMASRKGIIATGGILVAITLASFVIWAVPGSDMSAFVVSDHGEYLDGVKNIHLVLDAQIQEDFERLVDGEMTPDEYIEIAEVTTSQINAQIVGLVKSGAPESWRESYEIYIESLRAFNTYVRETVVIAEQIGDGAERVKPDQILDEIKQARAPFELLVSDSDQARP